VPTLTPSRTARRARRHYRSAHLALGATLALVSAVITGAWLVGDAVRESLRQRMELRLGSIGHILLTDDRVFHADLAERITAQSPQSIVAPVLAVEGMLVDPGDGTEAPGVLILGVDDRFWELSPGGQPPHNWQAGGIHANPALAALFHDGIQGEAVLRTSRPGTIQRDMAASQTTAFEAAGRLTWNDTLNDSTFAGFGLTTDPGVTPLAIVPIAELQSLLDLPQQANLLLLDRRTDADTAHTALQAAWQLADAGLALRPLAPSGAELRSPAVFLPTPIVNAARALDPSAEPLFGYFVNAIKGPSDQAPYCIVAGANPAALDGITADLEPGQIILNTWLADRIGAEPGDTIRMRYFELGERRTLREVEGEWTVARIIPIEGAAADRTLMPDFPGLADTASCYEWDPGLPVELGSIQPADEAYWQEHQGTPKAFLSLTEAVERFANPFGVATAVRFPHSTPDAIQQALHKQLDPTTLGLGWRDVRGPAEAATTEGLDFGQLFLSMSFFLVVAAAALGGLVVGLLVDQRTAELGLMRAVGFTHRSLRALWLREALPTALTGALLGLPLGLLFNHAMLLALNAIWQGATGGMQVLHGYSWQALLIGPLVTLLVAVWIVWRRLRERNLQPIASLLHGQSEPPNTPPPPPPPPQRWKPAAALIFLLTAIILLALSPLSPLETRASLFFGAGAALLGTLLFTLAACWQCAPTRSTRATTLRQVAWRQVRRQPRRNLGLVTVLAMAAFLVVGVGVNRKAPPEAWWDPSTGTGGFGWMARLSVPLTANPNDRDAMLEWGLMENEWDETGLVGLRERSGDDASCLNLGRAQEPALLGIPIHAFAGRWQLRDTNGPTDWEILLHPLADGEIPCAVDAATLQWGLGRSLGDSLQLQTGTGPPVTLRIVAVLDDSIFQGRVLIDEAAFAQHFPDAGGYRWLLGNLRANDPTLTADWVRQLFRNEGPLLEFTWERLARYLEVQNTYLAIFEWLGSLGLLLGAAGIGLVTLRNLLERRDEFRLLHALGFPLSRQRRLLLLEHWQIAAIAILGGATAGFVPLIASRAQALPTGSLTLLAALLLLILTSAFAAVWLAVRLGFHSARTTAE